LLKVQRSPQFTETSDEGASQTSNQKQTDKLDWFSAWDETNTERQHVFIGIVGLFSEQDTIAQAIVVRRVALQAHRANILWETT